MFDWNVGDWFYYNRDSYIIVGQVSRIAGPTKAGCGYQYCCECLFGCVNGELYSPNGFSKTSKVEKYSEKISAERAYELATELKAQYL